MNKLTKFFVLTSIAVGAIGVTIFSSSELNFNQGKADVLPIVLDEDNRPILDDGELTNEKIEFTSNRSASFDYHYCDDNSMDNHMIVNIDGYIRNSSSSPILGINNVTIYGEGQFKLILSKEFDDSIVYIDYMDLVEGTPYATVGLPVEAEYMKIINNDNNPATIKSISIGCDCSVNDDNYKEDIATTLPVSEPFSNLHNRKRISDFTNGDESNYSMEFAPNPELNSSSYVLNVDYQLNSMHKGDHYLLDLYLESESSEDEVVFYVWFDDELVTSSGVHNSWKTLDVHYEGYTPNIITFTISGRGPVHEFPQPTEWTRLVIDNFHLVEE